MAVSGEEEEERRRESGDRLGFKPGVGHGGHQFSCHHARRECGSEAKDLVRSPCSVNGPNNAYITERPSPFHLSNYEMEGATKWDPVCTKALNEDSDDSKLLDQKLNASLISALERELEQARARIEDLESERRISKKKLEHFLKKLSEEKAAWCSREHEKVRAIIDDMKSDMNRERKNRQRLEIVNSKLVNDLSEAKLLGKRYMQDYEKERKARELIEEVCDELAKEIGEDKAEVDLLRRDCLKLREEIEDERRMLQMAEVWREERVQMKLIDAKVALGEKYSQMNYLIGALEKFLWSKGVTLDVRETREAEMFRQASSAINSQDIKELFTYEPSNPDDVFAVFEEMAIAESHEREIEVSPEIDNQSKDSSHRLSDAYHRGDLDYGDDVSGWETASHVEDQGSSFSPQGSIISVNKMCRVNSNASGRSCIEWEEHVGNETPISEISEVCSAPSKHQKKVKSISRLWRSHPKNDDNYKVITVDGMNNNGRLSNGKVSSSGAPISPDHASGKSGFSPSDMVGWSSPDSVNTHINRGMKKGCVEWPRGGGVHQKQSLKHRLLEARMESQKIQLRQVLKQKI